MFSSNNKSSNICIVHLLWILAAAFMLMTPKADAEQLDAEVELSVDLLPFQKQERLEDLTDELEQYFRDFPGRVSLGNHLKYLALPIGKTAVEIFPERLFLSGNVILYDKS